MLNLLKITLCYLTGCPHRTEQMQPDARLEGNFMPCCHRKASGIRTNTDAREYTCLMKSLKESFPCRWPGHENPPGIPLLKPWLSCTGCWKYIVDFKSKLKLISALPISFLVPDWLCKIKISRFFGFFF